MADLKQYGDFNLSKDQNGRIGKLLDESDSLRIFIRGELVGGEAKQGVVNDLTVIEVRNAYLKFCTEKEWNAIPFQLIDKAAETLIGEYYQMGKSHDVTRDGKGQRGYHNLRFKKANEI